VDAIFKFAGDQRALREVCQFDRRQVNFVLSNIQPSHALNERKDKGEPMIANAYRLAILIDYEALVFA
jgi:hypothetical protein